jgi:hypothetical protein
MVPIFLAAAVSYLIGAWQPSALRGPEISAAESVDRRFPQNWNRAPDDLPATLIAVAMPRDADNAKLALLSPEPMAPRATGPVPPPPLTPPPRTPVPALPAQTEPVGPLALASGPQDRTLLSATASHEPGRPARSEAAAGQRRDDGRPGYMLNDKQIASIKERLHLTPDQQRMWPAVEAALRNVAYARTPDARGRATTANAAAVDPDSTEVQGLKTAAVPLIMSFNAEQKEEVRNLAHVMGLDQLANQF